MQKSYSVYSVIYYGIEHSAYLAHHLILAEPVVMFFHDVELPLGHIVGFPLRIKPLLKVPIAFQFPYVFN